MKLSTNDWPRMRSASSMARAPMLMAMRTPEPTVMPIVSDTDVNRASCDMFTAASASPASRLTQNASTAWYRV